MLARIDVSGVPAALRDRVLSSIPVHEGERINPANLPAIVHGVAEIDEHNHVSLRETGPDEVELVIAIGQSKPSTGSAALPMLSSVPVEFEGRPYRFGRLDSDEPGVKRIRLGGTAEQANLVTKVMPVYPPLAKQTHTQGKVVLNALIDREGKVKALELVSGEPLLADAAVDAVKQWVYRPVLLNGDPVEVITRIDVNFTLAE